MRSLGALVTAESSPAQPVCVRNERQEELMRIGPAERLRLALWPTMTAPPHAARSPMP
jgi:hypothetical protein